MFRRLSSRSQSSGTLAIVLNVLAFLALTSIQWSIGKAKTVSANRIDSTTSRGWAL